MVQKTLFSALLASLIGSCLLTGCATPFEKSYKPAVSPSGSPVTPAATPPLVRSRDPVLLWSRDPAGDGERLAQDGYVLIGTSSFDGAIDSQYAVDATIQGKKVGAAVVLLKVELATARHNMERVEPNLWNPNGNWVPPGGLGDTGTVFASYWAKVNAR